MAAADAGGAAAQGKRDFPAALQEEIEGYLYSLTKPRRGIDKKRLGACKVSTIRTRRNDLVSLAKKAVRLGMPIDSLTSMQKLLDPEVVALVIDDEWKKAGGEPKTTTIDLGKKCWRSPARLAVSMRRVWRNSAISAQSWKNIVKEE